MGNTIPKPSTKTPPLVNSSPETNLLLCCARTRMDTERADRIRALLREEIDWACLVRTARRHGLTPLLYYNLNATCQEAVPKATLHQLRDHFYANAGRNLFLADELLKLLKLFETHGTPAIPFKGPALAASVYGNLSLRESGDLDLLVHRKDILRTKTLLLSESYQPLSQVHSAEESTYLQAVCHLPEYHMQFIRDDGKVSVELHWDIASRSFSFPVDPECFWERLEWTSLGDTSVRSFSPEDLLLILCLHGAKHLWQCLKWVCDNAELVRLHQAMNWQWFMEKARKLGKERILLLGLDLAHDLLGAELPPDVCARMQADRMVQALGSQVGARLFRDADTPAGYWEMWSFYLGLRERRRDRIRHYVRYLRLKITPTKADRDLVPLPASLSFLYYLLRPIRVLGKYGLRSLKHLLAVSLSCISPKRAAAECP